MQKVHNVIKDSRQELVDNLIKQMEKGYAATREAWSRSSCAYNAASGHSYKGINRFRLMLASNEKGFSDPRWLTFVQVQERNYKIAAGSKGVLLEHWNWYKNVPVLDENQNPVIGADGKPQMAQIKRDVPIITYFKVFNGEQIIGLPELEHREVIQDDYTKMAETFEKSSLCPISYERQDKAYYSPSEDKIHLPLREAFKSTETRLSVLLHEMAHSTGNKDRLNRQMGSGFGSKEYAREELNAELSAAFIENELGIALEPDSEIMKDHANYVKSWIGLLKENPTELFDACLAAEKITGFLVKNYQTELETEQKLEDMELRYYTRNLGGTGRDSDAQIVKYENFENAFDAYKRAGLVDGKTLGVSVNGQTTDLAWYDSAKMENTLYNAAMPPKQYAPEALPETLEKLSKTGNRLLSELQKDNALIQLLDAVADIKIRSALEDQTDDQLKGRLVSCCEPQNFFDICVEDKKVVIQVVQENEIVDVKKTWISQYKETDKGAQVVSNGEAAEWMRDKIMNMDFKFPAYGQPAFTFYTSYGWTRLEEHEEILKAADKTRLLANESGIQFKDIVLKTIQEDIRMAGFKPTQKLVNNMLQFAKLEGKICTLKELAERKQEMTDLKDSEKEKCFRDIVEECQRQEVQSAKMEMMAEQSLAL